MELDGYKDSQKQGPTWKVPSQLSNLGTVRSSVWLMFQQHEHKWRLEQTRQHPHLLWLSKALGAQQQGLCVQPAAGQSSGLGVTRQLPLLRGSMRPLFLKGESTGQVCTAEFLE